MASRCIAALDLAGERVRLRLHRIEDARAAYALLAGEEAILRWLVWDGPSSPEELAAYYARDAVTDNEDLHLALEAVDTGELVGSLSLRFSAHPGQGDVGYWVGRPFQRRGLGGEALELAAHLSFTHLGAHALLAWVFVGNTHSRRVLERTGFTLVRTVPGRVQKRGARVDEWHFVLLASEWQRRRADFRPCHERLLWRPDPLESRASAGESPTPPAADG